MLRTTLLGVLLKRGWTDPIHDPDLLFVDLDFLHQGPDDRPSCVPSRLVQLVRDSLGELLQLADQQPEFRLLVRLADPLPIFSLQFGQPLSRRRDPWLELRLVDQPVAVGVDQSRNHLLHIIHQFAEVLHILARPRLRTPEPPLVLAPDPLRLGQQPTHVLPDRGVQQVGADLLVPAEPLAAEPIAVRARAAVVGVGDPALSLGRGPARRLAVAAVAAPLAHDQALEQISAATGPVAATLPILLELALDRPEEIFAHQPGDLDENLIFRGCVDPRDGTPGLLGTTTLRPETLRLEPARTRLAEGRRPLVGGVLEHQPDRRAIPGRFTLPGGDAVALQASADLADRAPLLADPLEDLPHDPRLFGDDLISCLAVALVLADVAVTVGRPTEHVDRAATCGVLLAPSATLDDLGTLVFGDHALDLEQQVLLGAAADGVAQEDDLDAAASEFFENQDLICIFA
jgi:hypothetical protein